MIAIIDYGMGNLKSVFNAFKQVSPEADIKVTSNPADIKSTSRRFSWPRRYA